jgi:hypothetical protein
MSLFEFAMMIASVVIAVGMTEIVGGWGRLARTSATIDFDWLHFGWTIVILLWLLNYWIGMFSYEDVPIDYVGELVFLVVPSLFGVLAAYAITPDAPLEGELVVRDYYWAKRKPVFLSLAVFSVFSALADYVIVGIESWFSATLAMHLALSTIAIILAFTKRVWLHASAMVLLITAFVLMSFTEIQTTGTRWVGWTTPVWG